LSRLDRSIIYSATPLFIGLVIGGLFLYFFYVGLDHNEKLDEIALGPENTFTLATTGQQKVHCEGGLEDIQACIDDYINYGNSRDLVLWLGNSQLHSINQFKLGDETSSSTLHRKLKNKKKYLLTLSHPNVNLQEHYLLFEYLTNIIPVSELILPVVFDDLRETGIRSGLLDILNNELAISGLKKTEIGNKILTRQNNQKSLESHTDALDGTEQEGLEEYLNSVLESKFDIWGDRSILRGKILLNLYKFRNWSLGITPSSIRKVIPGRYSINMMALNEIIDSARRKGIKVLVYIAPIRNDVIIPYDLNDYNEFKSEVISIGDDESIKIVNLENIIPAEYWGTKESISIGSKTEELDFMHFKSEGHEILSDRIFMEIKVENDF
jgi:hypothetical protein